MRKDRHNYKDVASMKNQEWGINPQLPPRIRIQDHDDKEERELSPEEKLKRTLCFLHDKLMADGNHDLQVEGAHGLWEMAVRKDYHTAFTEDVVRSLVAGVCGEFPDVRACAAGALWSLVISIPMRKMIISVAGVERLLLGIRLTCAEMAAMPLGEDAPPSTLQQLSNLQMVVGFILGCVAVILCEKDGRMRMVVPGLPLDYALVQAAQRATKNWGPDELEDSGPVGWAVLVELARSAGGEMAQQGTFHIMQNASDRARSMKEMAAESLCNGLARDLGGRRAMVQASARGVSPINELLALLKSPELIVARCAVAVLALYAREASGRELLSYCTCLPEIAEHLVDKLTETVRDVPLAAEERMVRTDVAETGAAGADKEMEKAVRTHEQMCEMLEGGACALWGAMAVAARGGQPLKPDLISRVLLLVTDTAALKHSEAHVAAGATYILTVSIGMMSRDYEQAKILIDNDVSAILAALLTYPHHLVREASLGIIGQLAAHPDTPPHNASLRSLSGRQMSRLGSPLGDSRGGGGGAGGGLVAAAGDWTCGASLTGPHREALVAKGMEAKVLACVAAAPKGSKRLVEAAAATLMLLSTVPGERKLFEIEGYVRLLRSGNPRVLAYTCAAIWCLCRYDGNTRLLGESLCVEELVGVEKRDTTHLTVRSHGSEEVTMAEWMVCALWMLMREPSNVPRFSPALIEAWRREEEAAIAAASAPPPRLTPPAEGEDDGAENAAEEEEEGAPGVEGGGGAGGGSGGGADGAGGSESPKGSRRGSARSAASMHAGSGGAGGESHTAKAAAGEGGSSTAGGGDVSAIDVDDDEGGAGAAAREGAEGGAEGGAEEGDAPVQGGKRAGASPRREVDGLGLLNEEGRLVAEEEEDAVRKKAEEAAHAEMLASTSRKNRKMSKPSRADLREERLERAGRNTFVDAIFLQAYSSGPDFGAVGALAQIIAVKRFGPGVRDKLKEISAILLHSLILQEPCYFTALLDLDVCNVLVNTATDARCSTGLRKVSAALFLELTTKVDGEVMRALMERTVIQLMDTGIDSLEELGVRGCAWLAVEVPAKIRLLRAGAVEKLVRLAATLPSMSTRELLMKALLNLSTNSRCQIRIAHCGLDLLVTACASGEWEGEPRRLACGVLSNIARNAHNRSLLYRAELRVKERSERLDGGESYRRMAGRAPGRTQELRPRLQWGEDDVDALPPPPSLPWDEGAGRGLGDTRGSRRSFATDIDIEVSMPEGAELSELSPSPGPSMAGGGAAATQGSVGGGSMRGGGSGRGAGAEGRARGKKGHQEEAEEAPDPAKEELKRRTAVLLDVLDDKKELKDRFDRWFENEVATEGPVRRPDAGIPEGLRDGPARKRAPKWVKRLSGLPDLVSPKKGGRKGKGKKASRVEITEEPSGDSTLPAIVSATSASSAQVQSLPNVGSTRSLIRSKPSHFSLAPGSVPARATPRDMQSRHSLPALQRTLRRPLLELWKGGAPGAGEDPWRPRVQLLAPIERDTPTRGAEGGSDSDEEWRREEGPPQPAPGVPEMTVVIGDAHSRRNMVQFAAGGWRTMRFVQDADCVKLSSFTHVEGSRVYDGLFPEPQQVPGTNFQVHLFQDRKALVDEEDVDMNAPAGSPDAVMQSYHTGLPLNPESLQMLHIMLPSSAPPVFLPKPGLPPRPNSHSPHVTGDDFAALCDDDSILAQLESEIDLTVVEDQEMGPFEEEDDWDINSSIFKARKKECESRDFYETSRTFDSMFEKDWSRLEKKQGFTRFCKTQEEMDDVARVLHENYEMLMRVFRYYCCLGSSEDIFNMKLNQWTEFISISQIPDKDSQFCKLKDCDTLFIKANFVEDKKSKENKSNEANALSRFEFLEILTRVSDSKYSRGRTGTGDLSDALMILIETNIKPNLPVEAQMDPNTFRKERLFNRGMDNAITEYHDVLKAVYFAYKAPTRSKFMSVGHWMDFTQDCKLQLSVVGASKRELFLTFQWSQMMLTDDLMQREKYTTLQLTEFIEAVCRLMEVLTVPTQDELLSLGFPTFYRYLLALEGQEAQTPREDTFRQSQGFFSAKTRPLHERAVMVFGCIAEGMRDKHNCASNDKLVKKLQKMAEL